MPKPPPPLRTKLTARFADRHVLYQRSVQEVTAEIDFVEQEFKALRNRRPTRLREDFCGTAATSCEWVRRHPSHTALGVDLDQATLDWGIAHNLSRLNEKDRDRVQLVCRDVRSPARDGQRMDAILAMNFSYWLLTTRKELVGYLKSVRASLVEDGLLFMDIYGGWEAGQVQKDRRKLRGFTYIWDQASFDPITNIQTAHIHFHFADRTKLKQAFSYTWRQWTIPEVRDVLADAGFERSIVYWEGDDRKGGGNGIFTQADAAENHPSFIAYLVAIP
jgi:hypothetical protein